MIHAYGLIKEQSKPPRRDKGRHNHAFKQKTYTTKRKQGSAAGIDLSTLRGSFKGAAGSPDVSTWGKKVPADPE